MIVVAALLVSGCGSDREDAQISDGSFIEARNTVVVQWGHSSDARLADASAKDLGDGRLAVRVEVDVPGDSSDDLALRCVRLRLDRSTSARRLVAWDGSAPEPGDPGTELEPEEIRSCPGRSVELQRP